MINNNTNNWYPQYNNCYSCKKPCGNHNNVINDGITTCNSCSNNDNQATINDCNKCNQPEKSCNCNNSTVIGVVNNNLDCNPKPCLTGCETTIKDTCVVLTNYCFINDCNCANTDITLNLWIKSMCLEIEKIKADIACLKTKIPSCNI